MKIYYCKTSDFLDLPGTELLSSSRRERVMRYLTASSKAECLAAGLLLRFVFGEHCEQTLTTNKYGKPQFPKSPPYFNLSHSGDFVVLALTDCEVGIDIQKTGAYNPKIINTCCTANEKEWLKQQTDENAFYYLWTGKEAVMKATGKGFSMGPLNIDLLPVADGPHTIAEQLWYLKWFSLEQHQICVASSDCKNPQFIYLERNELLQPVSSDLSHSLRIPGRSDMQ